MFVQCQIPASNRPAPVAERPGKGVLPLSPIGCIVRAGEIGTTFGPVHVSFGMCHESLKSIITGAAVKPRVFMPT